MAKKATRAKATSGAAKKPKRSSGGSKAVAKRASGGGGGKKTEAGDAFIRFLQSPLVTDLLAVAATAALASLAEHGVSSRNGGGKPAKRAGKAAKAAGKAAANAIGRRLSEEIDEIRKASKAAKGGAKA